MNEIFYTIVDEDFHSEERVEISYNNRNAIIQFPKERINVSSQQLAELGSLLIALSGYNFDLDSVHELIEGYGDNSLISPM